MSSRRRLQVHPYTPFDMERLKGIPVPPKIKCGRCYKNLPPTKYSTKQLTDLRSQIHQTGRQTAAINCQTCTGQHLVELECTICHKTKGLEDFAKSQKSKPDTARCFKCTDDQVNHQPVSEDHYNGTRRAFVTPDSYKGYMPDYWSSADSSAGSSATNGDEWASVNGDRNEGGDEGGVALSRDFQRTMSINGSISDTLIDTEFTLSGGGQNGNVDNSSDVYTRSWHTRSTGPGSATVGSSGHRNASATSNIGTQRSYASTVAERSYASGIQPNGWAKIKAYRSPLPAGLVRPAGDADREYKEAWGSDEESVEEDEGSDDSDGDNTIL